MPGLPIHGGPSFADCQVLSASPETHLPPTGATCALSPLAAYRDFNSHFYPDFEKRDILERKSLYNKAIPVSEGCQISLSDCAGINRHACIIALENISFELYYKTVFMISSIFRCLSARTVNTLQSL